MLSGLDKRLLNSCSDSIGIPLVSADFNFDPGDSPATRKLVFPVTEEVADAPSDFTRVSASLLVMLLSEPVMTNVNPTQGELDSMVDVLLLLGSIPRFRSLSIMSRLLGTAKYLTRLAAILGPIP